MPGSLFLRGLWRIYVFTGKSATWCRGATLQRCRRGLSLCEPSESDTKILMPMAVHGRSPRTFLTDKIWDLCPEISR